MPRKPRFRNTGAGKGIKDELDAATLKHLYIELGLTQTAIAERYGCTPQFISLLVREYGLVRSPGSKAKLNETPA